MSSRVEFVTLSCAQDLIQTSDGAVSQNGEAGRERSGGYSRHVHYASAAGTLSALIFRQVLATLPAVGVDPERVRQSCGLPLDLLEDPNARIDAEREHEFWACVESVADDAAVGVRLGAVMARAGGKTLDEYVVRNSSNWRSLIANADVVAGLTDDRGRVALFEEDSRATVRTYREGGFRRAGGYIDAIYSMVVAVSLERVPGFRLSSIELRRPRPRSAAAYVDAFGVSPRFDAEHNQLSFPRELLDVPLHGADPALGDYLKAHALTLLREMPQGHPLLLRVQRALVDGLERGRSGMPAIARATGMSPRTLRRRLSALGTSFQQLSDDVRRDLACHRLRHHDDSVNSLAERLGFGSTSAFQRAFARWTGSSVSAFRERARRV